MSQAPTPTLLRVWRRHRSERRRVALLTLAPAAAGGGTAPQLLMAEPEDRRVSIIAGSLTTAVHAAALGVLILLAWLAPPVEEIIEVTIIRELPGSNAEPAPARKVLKPRQLRKPIQATRQIVAQAAVQPRRVDLAPQQPVNLRALDQAAPQQVRRRQVVSSRPQARSFDYRVENADVVATQLEAPVVDLDGPRQIPSQVQAPVDLEAPQVADVAYESVAPVEVVSDVEESADLDVVEFDADVGAYAGGEGTGGTGTAVGVVRCFESAFVVRYIDVVEERTKRRWQVPEGTPDDAVVVLRFTLDASGAATQISFDDDVHPAFGQSAVAAMRAASPFPPMNDNVRCLAGEKLRGTFTNPAL